MLRVSILFALVSISAIINSVTAEKVQLYTDKYDYVDYDEILDNVRIRNQYYNCYLGSGPCLTPDAKFFKGMNIFKSIHCFV